jgi:hypothetical protein
MKFHYLLIVLALFVTGCSKKAYVQFTQKPPELTSSDALTEIMLVNKSPRIVLRVPNTRKGVTNTQGTGNQTIVRKASNSKMGARTKDNEVLYDETALYNAIEKQLFKEGFSVRDRGLFNEVLDANQSVNYSKINAFTNTDLILELVRLDNPIGYTTNVCYTYPTKQEKLISEYRDMGGASVEFKLVHVKTNEIVGSYKIHYTPCLEGCRGIYKKASASRGVFVSSPWMKPGERDELRRLNREAYQTLDQNELEAFIADSIRQLVKTMR